MFCPNGQAVSVTTATVVTLTPYDVENGVFRISSIGGNGDSTFSVNSGNAIHIISNTAEIMKIPVGTTTITLTPSGPGAVVFLAIGVNT